MEALRGLGISYGRAADVSLHGSQGQVDCVIVVEVGLRGGVDADQGRGQTTPLLLLHQLNCAPQAPGVNVDRVLLRDHLGCGCGQKNVRSHT